jgi:hypothetical protein
MKYEQGQRRRSKWPFGRVQARGIYIDPFTLFFCFIMFVVYSYKHVHMGKDSDRKNIALEIVIYLHVFDMPDYVKFFWNAICLYVRISPSMVLKFLDKFFYIRCSKVIHHRSEPGGHEHISSKNRVLSHRPPKEQNDDFLENSS